MCKKCIHISHSLSRKFHNKTCEHKNKLNDFEVNHNYKCPFFGSKADKQLTIDDVIKEGEVT